MVRLIEMFPIGYHTKMHEIPAWLQPQITSLGGPGFKLAFDETQYQWYQYVAKTSDGKFIVLSKDDIDNIVHNAKLVKDKYGCQ